MSAREPLDLDAIREDIELSKRSPEMARHVALDHGPELVAAIEKVVDLCRDTGTYQARAKLMHCGSARLLAMAILDALGGVR